jgi:hypothetical protein
MESLRLVSSQAQHSPVSWRELVLTTATFKLLAAQELWLRVSHAPHLREAEKQKHYAEGLKLYVQSREHVAYLKSREQVEYLRRPPGPPEDPGALMEAPGSIPLQGPGGDYTPGPL